MSQRQDDEDNYCSAELPSLGQEVSETPRYEKRHSNIAAHVSPCIRMKEGDHIIIGQRRALSKTVRFNVLKVIPAGSSGGRKKEFSGM